MADYKKCGMENRKPLLLMVVNADVFFLSHRLPIALKAKEEGYDVHIVTTDSGKKSIIESYGLIFVNVKFDRSGKNPFKEFYTIYTLWKIYRKSNPDIIHHVSIKPCIYGSIAAKLAGVKKIVNAITGLGYSFTDNRKGLFQSFLIWLLHISTKGNLVHFIFQNREDAKFIIELNKLKEGQYSLIKGSGVDLQHFSYNDEPDTGKVRIILPARILYDKGVIEFCEAAKKIKNEVNDIAEFILVGKLDPDNLAGIKEEELNKFLVEGYINWGGYSEDIYSVLKQSHIVVLPSYREGLPKSLIEANAVGRPIVTTNVPGCRDCVINGVNGFTVPLKSIDELAEKIKILVLDKSLRVKMGKNARIYAENNFSLEDVVRKHLEIYNKLEG